VPIEQDVVVRHQHHEHRVVAVVSIDRRSAGVEDVSELVSESCVGADDIDRFGTQNEFERSVSVDGQVTECVDHLARDAGCGRVNQVGVVSGPSHASNRSGMIALARRHDIRVTEALDIEHELVYWKPREHVVQLLGCVHVREKLREFCRDERPPWYRFVSVVGTLDPATLFEFAEDSAEYDS
jgi:hypothetical protein